MFKMILKSIVGCCIFLLLSVTGCNKTASMAPLPDDAVVMAFGDSLTYGTGVNNKQSYPMVLSRLISRKVINVGIPGELSEAGLHRLPGLLDEYHPDLLILTHGGNDILRKKPLTALKANLLKMINLSRQRGIEVVMLGVPKPGIFMSSADLYPEVAEQTQTAIDTDVLADILSQSDLKSDAVHPNAAGYQIMAEAIADLLRDRGAI